MATIHSNGRQRLVVQIGRSVAAALIVCVGSTLAQERPGAVLADLSLEQLLDVEVVSVTKSSQRLESVAAAVHVITNNDIRRSGARTLADVLRTVPGIQVARLDSGRWALSSRGFADQFANNLLVLIDGRSVYTSVFSGVFWDAQDPLLEDIERIEVIRGPGGSSWGANAVNGVINIITRSAHDTLGGHSELTAGTEQLAGAFRYGAKLDENTAYRVWGKAFARDDSALANGDDAHDAWRQASGGLRLDGGAGAHEWMVQGSVTAGEVHASSIEFLTAAPYTRTLDAEDESIDFNVLGHWQRSHDDGARTFLQSYFSHFERDAATAVSLREHVVDFEARHLRPPAGGHRLMASLGVRATTTDVGPGRAVRWREPNETRYLTYLALQDTIAIVEDAVDLTVGVKLEHNDFTGVEVSPDARLLWSLGQGHSLWGAASRAVRTPSVIEDSIQARFSSSPGPGGAAIVGVANGNPELDAETIFALDVGYRYLGESTVLDLAAFANQYRGVIGLRQGAPSPQAGPPPYLEVPLTFDNNAEADTYGFEAAATWSPAEDLQLRGSYSLLRVHAKVDDAGSLLVSDAEGSAPRHQVHLRTSWNFAPDFELDALASYVDHLSAGDVPSYVRLDLRLGWHATGKTELSLVGQNLLEDRHAEYGQGFTVAPSEFERAAFFTVRHRF